MNNLTTSNNTGNNYAGRNEYKAMERQTERAMVLDLHKETDFQQELINAIGNDIKGTNENLQNVMTNLDGQGKQIDKITKDVVDTGATIHRTDKVITRMTTKAFCIKAGLHVLVVLLFLVNIALIVLKIKAIL